MNKSFKSGRTFWLIIGIITIIMILLLAYALSVPEVQESEDTPPASQTTVQPAVLNPQAGLGEEGAECGGDMNLPCRPGLACLGATTEQATGVCTKMTDKDPGRIEPPQELRSQKPEI